MCEVSSTDVELEEFFSYSNICLISLRGLESMGESTGTSPADFFSSSPWQFSDPPVEYYH